MGAYCSCGSCCANVLPKPTEHGRHSRKRPWRRSENSSLIANHEIQTSSDTFTLSRPNGSVYKNRRADGISSSENMARSSSIFLDMEDDGFDRTAMSQLLVQVTDLLANSENEDMKLQLQLSPNTQQSLEMEIRNLSKQDQIRQLPILREILRVSSSKKPLFTSTHELYQLERELFMFLAGQEEQDLDPLVTLRRCLTSKRVKPPYNRFLQLHLRSLLQHPSVQDNVETKNYLLNFLERLGMSPEGLELIPEDGNFLLELITMTNVPIFSPVSSPPTIFDNRESPLMLAAMRMAAMSFELQKLAESREIVLETQKSMLEEVQNITMAKINQSCPSVRFYSRVIPHRDRARLADLVSDLIRASKNSSDYKISKSQAGELSDISKQLGEIALICAKFKVARALHIIKNRFRISPQIYQRICVIGKENHELMTDALLLINVAGIANSSEIIRLSNLFNGESDAELMEDDAAYLEHLLIRGIDFQTPRHSLWHSLGDTDSVVDDKVESILPVDSSVVRNPFALSKTPEPCEITDSMINEFFTTGDDTAYENSSLIKPLGESTTAAYPGDFKSSRSDLISNQRTLPKNDAQYYFKLISETLILRRAVSEMQSSPSQLFLFKVAPFQIIQLCDCVRKLSSVEPDSANGGLLKKLSIEANRHQKLKLKSKTVGQLKDFYHRVNNPVFQSGTSKLTQIIEKQKVVPLKNEIKLSTENIFSETEICLAVLFDKIDSLSLFFLESIQQRCVTKSANAIMLSRSEFIKLSVLAQEAIAELRAVKSHISTACPSPGNVAKLLCLYKMRALMKTEDNSNPRCIYKRLLWKHALTQFFNFYPEKALKSPFYRAAFNIFVEESDHLSQDIKGNMLKEIQFLIEGSEKAVNYSTEAVNNLLSLKTERSKVVEALKSKFVVSVVNNRQLNCDATAVGMWILELDSQPYDPLSTFLKDHAVEDIKQFLLTKPETQELNETSLTDKLVFSGSDKNLASFKPLELTRMASFTTGIVQTSPTSKLVYILFLEALLRQYNQPKIFMDRTVIAELQGIPTDSEVNEASIKAIEEASNLLKTVDEVEKTDETQVYVKNLLLDQNKLVSPRSFDKAIKILKEIRSQSSQALDEINALKIEVADFNRKIDSFLDTDKALLYAIVSLRGLQPKIIIENAERTNFMELLFVLTVSRNHISRGSPFYKDITAQIAELRHGLVDGEAVNVDSKIIEQLLINLELKLTNDLVATVSGCVSQLSNMETIVDLGLLNTLQFVCIAVVLLQVDIEAKLLAILLCRPISSLSAETSPLVQAILIEISKRLQCATGMENTKYLRLVASLLPMTLESDNDQSSVEFSRLLTTVCVANELSNESGGSISSKLNHKLSEIFWMIFVDREHLKPGGIFDGFFKWTSIEVSEWLEADVRNPNFFANLFYTAARLPLDKTKDGQLPEEFKDDPFQMESFFCILQSLLVVTVIMKYTEPQILLTRNQLITLYHAAVICVHSGHFHGRLEAKAGLICLLIRIENFYPAADLEQVPLENIFFGVPGISTLIESSMLDAEKSIIENLRSHIAPVILPLGSEAGVPFMTPDTVVVREGLETSLCGYFSISPTDALSGFQILSQLKYTKLSTADLAIIYRVINYLFKDDAGKFTNPSGQISGCVVDFPDDLVESVAIEAALSNLNVFSTIGGLKSTKEVEIFFKSLFVLSSSIGSKESGESLLSGTVVSSPSDTYSSFSVSHSNGRETFLSLESSPKLSKTSIEQSPEEGRTLLAPIQRLDRYSDVKAIEDLLDIYHHARLLLQAGASRRCSVEVLTKAIPEFVYFLPSREESLTDLQTEIVVEISLECHDRIQKCLSEVLPERRGELSLKILCGYFSMRQPTKVKVPVAAHRLLTLRIVRIRRDLTQDELKSYAKNNLVPGSISSSPETMILAIQAAQKALEGFTLNLVEQICLFYSIPLEDGVLFADLGAAISWMEVWPVQMSPQQRSYLANKLHQWIQTISNSINLLKIKPLNPVEVCKLAAVWMFAEVPPNEVLKIVDSCSESVDDPKLRLLRVSIEPSAQDLVGNMEFLREKLSAGALDEFTTACNTEILHLISGFKWIALNTDWLAMNQEAVNDTCRKLYLTVACNSSVEDNDAKIELPRRYLHFPEMLSILRPHFLNKRKENTSAESVARNLQESHLNSYRFRPKGVHSVETIPGSLLSLRSRTFTKGSNLDLNLSGYSTPYRRSSLNRLQEFIEIRRAVVAGSKCELDKLSYGFERPTSEAPKIKSRVPDKLDLSLLRRRCEMHTKHLIQRANYEQKQSELFCNLMHHNLRLASQRT